MENDIEEYNYESLKEQVERLKLQQFIYNDKQPQIIQQKIYKAVEKKQKMEEELNTLHLQKKARLQQAQQKQKIFQQKLPSNNQAEVTPEITPKFNPQEPQVTKPPLPKNQIQDQQQLKSARGLNNEKVIPHEPTVSKEPIGQKLSRNNSIEKPEEIRQTPKVKHLKQKISQSEMNQQKYQSPSVKQNQHLIMKNHSNLNIESNNDSSNNLNSQPSEDYEEQIQNKEQEKDLNEQQIKDLNPRDQVLWRKEQKKKQDQQRIIEQLNQITKENYNQRNYAKEKLRQQQRPSMENLIANEVRFAPKQANENLKEKITQVGSQNSMDKNSLDKSDNMSLDSPISTKQNQGSINFPENRKTLNQTPQKSIPTLIEDPFDGMGSDFHANMSRDVYLNEEDQQYLENLDQQIVEVENKIQNQTSKIDTLNETLKTFTQEFNNEILDPSQNQVGLCFSRLENVDPIEEVEEIDEEQKIDIFNPNPVHKLQERCKLLKYRCEAGIGNNLYQQAYEYLEKSQDSKTPNEEIRKGLIEILGQENIGFWQILDQIIYINKHVIPNM